MINPDKLNEFRSALDKLNEYYTDKGEPGYHLRADSNTQLISHLELCGIYTSLNQQEVGQALALCKGVVGLARGWRLFSDETLRCKRIEVSDKRAMLISKRKLDQKNKTIKGLLERVEMLEAQVHMLIERQK